MPMARLIQMIKIPIIVVDLIKHHCQFRSIWLKSRSQYDAHLLPWNITHRIHVCYIWCAIDPINTMTWNCLIPPDAPSRWAPPRTRLSASAAARGAREGSRRWLPCRWLSNLAPCNLGNVRPNGFLKPSETNFLNMLKPWKPRFFCFCLVRVVYPVCHMRVGAPKEIPHWP